MGYKREHLQESSSYLRLLRSLYRLQPVWLSEFNFQQATGYILFRVGEMMTIPCSWVYWNS